MVEVVKLRAEHIEWLSGKGGLGYLTSYLDWDRLKQLEKFEWGFSVISPVGGVLVSAGIVPFWENRGELWAIFNPRCKDQFLLVHRALKRILDTCPIKRLEAVVDLDFAPGHRWVKILGFEMETPRMRAYNVKGGDASLYVRLLGE